MFMMWITFSVLPWLSPRIPPFLGYFLCRSSRDWLGVDTCRLDDDGLFNIPRGNVVFNLFRMVGGLISLVAFMSSILNAGLVVMHEIFPSIVFQNDRLAQLGLAARNCTFSDHAQILRQYRELQILNIMFNKIYQRDYFVFCMGTVILVMVANGYSVITMRMHHISGIFVMLGFYLTFMEYIILITLFRMASKVWSNSIEFAWSWKRNDRLAKLRLTRRYGKCLQPLKVKMGSTNFVELNTPFLFFSFCMEQTISLVLLNQ
jgi:hypothetical protein